MYNKIDFENMGKAAASEYVTNNKPLNDSIVKIAERYGLNSAQIARVVEQANVETYLKLNKVAEDKYIEYDPADHVKISSALDFKIRKVAAISKDYFDLVAPEEYEVISGLSEEEIKVLDKAESKMLKKAEKEAFAFINRRLEELDVSFSRESETLYNLVKQATLETGKFGLVKRAMIEAVPGSITKIVVEAFKTKLQKEATCVNYDDIEQSPGALNTEHPLVQSLIKLSILKDEYAELKNFNIELEKRAGSGVKFFRHLFGAAGQGVKWVGGTVTEVFKGVMKVPALVTGVVALGVGTQIGKAKGRSEKSKANVRLNREYVQRAKNLRPL